jgi:hypothetical protein
VSSGLRTTASRSRGTHSPRPGTRWSAAGTSQSPAGVGMYGQAWAHERFLRSPVRVGHLASPAGHRRVGLLPPRPSGHRPSPIGVEDARTLRSGWGDERLRGGVERRQLRVCGAPRIRPRARESTAWRRATSGQTYGVLGEVASTLGVGPSYGTNMAVGRHRYSGPARARRAAAVWASALSPTAPPAPPSSHKRQGSSGQNYTACGASPPPRRATGLFAWRVAHRLRERSVVSSHLLQ